MGPPEKRARTEDVESHATNPLNITFTARPKKISSQQIVPKEPHVSPDNNFSWLSSENASIKKIISQLSQSDRDVTLNALKKINTACIQNEKNMLDFLRRGGIEALEECFRRFSCSPSHCAQVARIICTSLNRSYRHTLKFILSPSKAKGSVIAAANPMSASLKKCGLIVASLLKHIVGTLQEEVSESNLSPGQKKICCIIAIILSYGHQDVVAALMKPVWEILKDLTSFVKIVGVDGVLEIAFHVFRRFRLDQEGTPREAFSEVIKSMLDFLQRLIVDWLDAERWKTLSTKRVVLLFTLALSMPKYLVTAEKLSVLDMILGWMKCFTRQFFKLLREVKKEDVEIRFDMALQAMFCFLADLSDNHWELHDVYVETLDNLGSWIVDESVSLLVQYFFLLIFTMKAEKEETTARKLANIPVFPHLVSIIVKHIFSSQTPDISQLERQYGKRIFPWKVLFRIYVDHRPIALLNSKALDCFDLDISLGSGDMERWAVEMRREMCHAVLNRCTEPEVFKVLLIHHIFLRVPMQYFDKRFPHVLHDRYFQEFGLHLAQDDPLILADLMVLVSMAKSCDDCRAFLYREQLVLKTVQLLTKKVPELFEIADFLGFEELAVDLETHIRNMSTKRPEKLLTVFHATQGTDMEEVTMVSMCRTSLSSTEKPHTSTCYRATQADSVFHLRNPDNLFEFLRQSELLEQIKKLHEELSVQKKVIDAQKDEDEDVEATVLATEPECLKMDKPLQDQELAPSLALPLKDYGFVLSDVIAASGIDMDIPEHGGFDEAPLCDYPIPSSMKTFEHLEGIQDRDQLMMDVEAPLLSNLFNDATNAIAQFAPITIRLLEKRPEAWEGYLLATLYWRIEGEASKAIECARRALYFATEKRAKILVLHHMGYILHRARQHLDALILFHAAHDLAPTDDIILASMGYGYALIGEANASAQYFKRALRYNPDKSEYRLMYYSAVCFAKVEKALQDLHGSLQNTLTELRDYQSRHQLWMKTQEELVQVQATREMKAESQMVYEEAKIRADPNGGLGDHCIQYMMNERVFVSCGMPKQKDNDDYAGSVSHLLKESERFDLADHLQLLENKWGHAARQGNSSPPSKLTSHSTTKQSTAEVNLVEEDQAGHSQAREQQNEAALECGDLQWLYGIVSSDARAGSTLELSQGD
ncbi:unnamed protein product [Cyprideis torosa]|uniref:Uncharacterized protein n=1 Tax=Cyprideis torosa TaxID=163714 RepID=A0A7R8W8A7_9CRUS|nr:unnamed protein product [Cyprideis torosa]CAG0883577.1 unnamed protein product [Cyprideis torosa]